MERLRWPDERLDERMAAIDKGFDRQFEELRVLREDMRAGFAALRVEIECVRAEVVGVRAEVASVRSDLAAFQRQVTLVVAGFGVGLLGLLGAGQL